jgi:two-component system response regulator AtoC
MHHILIVDDNVKLCHSLSRNFTQYEYTCYTAYDTSSALRIYLDEEIDLVLLDVRLGEENGLDLMQQLRELNHDLPVIMITAFATVEAAVQSIKFGAFDYIQKPINFKKLLKIVENALQLLVLKNENDRLKNRLHELSTPIISNNPEMLKLHRKAQKLAPTELPILIYGESGTGKELIADYIHRNSNRSSSEIVKINCSAFPESLLDNELFGHEKGAYTGADSAYKGVFERAHRCTLFLDEIGDMPLSIQAKILRTIQNGEIRRLGGKHKISVDIRFLAATNKELESLIHKHNFRSDLFYRLNAATLYLPPLRERKDDIPLLADFFLKEFGRINGINTVVLDERVLTHLLEYDWPGNIRELKNTINYAATVSTDERITLDDLPPRFVSNTTGRASDINVRERVERELIVSMLRKTNQNKTKAAQLLNMSRKTLYNKMTRYEISTATN